MIKKIMKYGVANATPIFSGIFTAIVLTKQLNVEEYGEYSLLSLNILIIASILFNWLNSSLLRFYKHYQSKGELKDFLETYYIIYFSLSFLVLLIGGILVINKKEYAILASLLIIFTGLNSMKMTINRITEKDKKYMNQVLIIEFFKILGILFFVWKLKLGIKGVLLSFLLPLIIVNFKELKFIKIKPISKNYLEEALKYGVPLIGVFILNQLLINIDKYMIKFFLDNEALGYYSFVYKVSNISVGSISKTLMLLAFPIILRAYEKFGEEAAVIETKKFIKIYSFICIITIGIIYLVLPILIKNYFEKYMVTVPLFKYIVFGIFLNGICQYVNKPFELKKDTIKITFLLLISGIINTTLNLYLIPKFSYFGAAYSTFLSYIAYILISFFIVKKQTK